MTTVLHRRVRRDGAASTADPRSRTAAAGAGILAGMEALRACGVVKTFGEVTALRGTDLDVRQGEIAAILGPSGCGKTTLLRVLAGFERPDGGSVVLAGRTVVDDHDFVPPQRRDVGYVAQEGSLFPHLTVARNITFGLPRAARRRRAGVDELLALVGLDANHAARYPDQLSGGQQQRVALARALAPRPSVVLLDEPFAALDEELRVDTRRAVVAALRASGATAVLVTHNQAEALSVADRVAVMRDGRVVQHAPPVELYTAPADPAVARFVGDAVVLDGRLQHRVATCALGDLGVETADSTASDGPVQVMIRPEQVVVRPATTDDGIAARVEESSYYGRDATVTLRLDDGTIVTARCAGDAPLHPGEHVHLTVSGPVRVYRVP